jgi:phosphinothricin acetyltransferase
VPSDAGPVQAIYAPIVRDTAISFEIDPPSIEEMSRRISLTLERWPWLVCEDQGEVTGYVYAGRHRERGAYRFSVDVTVYIHEKARRTGIGRALYQLLFELVALQGYTRAYAGITLPNEGSVGLHESLGFALVGVYRDVGYKLGVWHDVGWWQMPLRPLPVIPNEPLSLAAASELPSFAAAFERANKRLRSA